MMLDQPKGIPNPDSKSATTTCRSKDNVNHPSHYTQGIEVIDILKDKLTPEQFDGFCLGNILKYTMRARHKNGMEDLKKAQWYLDALISCGASSCQPKRRKRK